MIPRPTNQRSRIVWQAILCLTLIIVTVGVYLPVRDYGFVNPDDNLYVTENPGIRGGLTWPSVQWALTAGLTHHDVHVDYWRPVSVLSHALDIELFGLRPAGHHLMNVGIHAAAAVMLFLVLQSMTNAPWRCALLAALFAWHPLRVESVAWVTERKDVLSGLLFMLTLGAYVRYVRGPSSMSRYLAVCFAFALALMSKSMVVTLPFVLLLLDYWPLGRTRWAPPEVAGSSLTRSPSQLLKEKLPLFALAAATSMATLWGQRTASGMNPPGEPPGIQLANVLPSYVRYIGKMLWPSGLAVWYPRHAAPSAAVVTVAGIGLLAVTAAVIGGARRRPWLVTGWFWYLGMLVPVIGVFWGMEAAMADRFTYLPSIGLALMLCWSVPWRATERRSLNVMTGVTAGAVLAACAALSRVQVEYWKDSETLFRHAVDVTRDNWRAHYNLGCTLSQTGKIPDAIRQYEEALRIDPEFAPAHNNLGLALSQSGRYAEAIDQHEQALRITPDYADAHYNLGLALVGVGRLSEGIEQYKEALRIDPDSADAHNNLGVALLQLGSVQEAVGHWEQALRLNPDYAEAHNNLGFALVRLGRVPEAIAHYEQALRLKPDYAEARKALARLQAHP